MRNQTGAFAYFGKEIKVVIDFYHEPAYVLDRFPNSRLLWTKNGVSRIEIISNDGEGIKLWLSMQGDMLKIISPVYLKNWLVENLQKTLSYYQNSLPLEEKRREEKRREEKRREEKRREEKRREEKRIIMKLKQSLVVLLISTLILSACHEDTKVQKGTSEKEKVTKSYSNKKGKTQESSSTVSSASKETGVSSEDAEKIYQSVIQKYQSAIETKDNQADINIFALTKNDIEVAQFDFNNDGIDEFVVGSKFDGQYPVNTILDLYTIDESKAVVRLTNKTNQLDFIGERTILTPLGDGTFYLKGSSGATDQSEKYYDISKGDSELSEIDSSDSQPLDLNSLTWNSLTGDSTEAVETTSSDSELTNLSIGETISFPEELVGEWASTNADGMVNPHTITINADGSYSSSYNAMSESGNISTIKKVAEDTYAFVDLRSSFGVMGVGGTGPNFIEEKGFVYKNGTLIPQYWQGSGSVDYSTVNLSVTYTKK
ncbi:hypothetical protein [Streptococcus hyovaginalis]|uniref:hypothetical protein n=2 Tax=Streptococcus hyovaginalis TaxID=149015 RepID=UPI003B3B5017